MTADAGLFTLFLLVLADSLGVPAPGDSALLVAGALASEGRISLTGAIAVASVAAILGDTIVFWVGRLGGRRVLARDGRFVDQRRSALSKADAFFERYGLLAVFTGKFVPGVRGVTAFAAGASGMNWFAFAAVNATACLSWTALVIAAGFTAGPTAVLIVLVVAFSAAALVWVVRRRRVAASPNA